MSNSNILPSCSSQFWSLVLQADLSSIGEGLVGLQVAEEQEEKEEGDFMHDKFEEELEKDLEVLEKQVVEEYEGMKQGFQVEVVTKMKDRKEIGKKEVEEVAKEVAEVEKRRSETKIKVTEGDKRLNCVMGSRHERRMKQFVFRAWKRRVRRKRILKRAEEKMLERRKRMIFDRWRVEAHKLYKQKVDDREIEYSEQRRREVIPEWDDYIDTLRNYIKKLQEELKVEVKSKTDLVKLYEQVMNGSIEKFHQANNFISNVDHQANNINNDTFGRFQEDDQNEESPRTIYQSRFGLKSTDIQQISISGPELYNSETLIQQTDPDLDSDY